MRSRPCSSLRRWSIGVLVLLCALSGATLSAQCSNPTLPGPSLPGTNGQVHASVAWDPDGPGPMNELVVLGGSFTVAGGELVNNIVAFDPVTNTWSTLGAGCNGTVRALVVMPDGSLVAGGDFVLAGLNVSFRVARWNGSAWSSVGLGVNGNVWAMTVMPNGHLIVGGDFTEAEFAPAVPAAGVAGFDGTSWYGVGFGSTQVRALHGRPNGELIVGHGSGLAGGVPAFFLARYYAGAWSALGSGVDSTAWDMVEMPNGDLAVAGTFWNAGGVQVRGVGRWDGTSWSAFGGGLPVGGSAGGGYSLAVLPNGDLVAGGEFTIASGAAGDRVARWDGAQWQAMGPGFSNRVASLTTMSNGDVIAAGFFTGTGTHYPALRVARWDGSSWQVLGGGIAGPDQPVRALAVMPGGEVAVGGYFKTAGGQPMNNVGSWDGTSWSPFGSGLGFVGALQVSSNGHVFAAGDMPIGGGGFTTGVFRWDGNAWNVLGSAPAGSVLALAELPNGDLVAGGWFSSIDGVVASRVARWDGATWSPLGAGVDDLVAALTVLPNGDLIAGGQFTTAGGIAANRIARWDGATWSSFGSGINDDVLALAVRPDGDVIAGGYFTMAGGNSAMRCARWDGVSWSPLGSGMNGTVFALAVLPDGDVVAGGGFTTAGGVACDRLARWDGLAWSPFGGGANDLVSALAVLPDGDVVAGGYFTNNGVDVHANILRVTTDCPATVTQLAAGCPSSGGANLYEADNLPWIGSTYQATATGMPVLAFVAIVTGFGPIAGPLPLGFVFPVAAPGCVLHVQPDVLDVAISSLGTLTTQVVIPDTMSLAGVRLEQQLIPFELDLSLQVTEVTATNALALTIGAF